jgi:hypothetical protein
MAVLPEIDPTSALHCIVNAAAGSSDAEARREIVEAALRADGRRGDLLFCRPAELTAMGRAGGHCRVVPSA